jgi:hypothetical protein
MTIDERIAVLAKLGKFLHAIDADEFGQIMLKIRSENPWFTQGSVELSLEGVRRYLDPEKMRKWVAGYRLAPVHPKQIAVVMAGNIPLAGFHDFLTVLISGHNILIKLSSKDSVLPTFIANKLIEIEPRFGPRITLAAQLKNFDAVIATGSDNSSRYFHYYFGKYPTRRPARYSPAQRRSKNFACWVKTSLLILDWDAETCPRFSYLTALIPSPSSTHGIFMSTSLITINITTTTIIRNPYYW